MMDEIKYCFVQFKCNYTTNYGEELRVVGNIQELGNCYLNAGNWETKRSERMLTSSITFPTWKTKECIKVRQDSRIEYRYIIFKEGKFYSWEKNKGNRVLDTKNFLRIIIHDHQDSLEGKIEKFTNMNTSVLNNISDSRNDIISLDITDRRIKTIYHYDKKMDLCLDDKSNLSKEAESFDKFSDLDYGSDSDEELGNNDINENIKKDSSEIKAENIVIASAFLPFDLIKKENSNKWDVEIVDNPFYNSLYKLSENNQNITWVGCFRNQFDLKEEELDSLINSLKKRRILIVKVDKETFFQFCNIITDVFEPIFHYYSFFHDRKTIRNFDELWKAYKRFNEAFSKVISNYISDGTLVWVHDYHLLLTANFLISQKVLEEKNNKNYSIGLFIHAPFPGSDVFKRFPYRDEILKSMMCFDMIGFHTFDSSRSFFTSCKRLLQINYESTKEGALALSYFGRNVFLYVKHISCEIQLIKEELNKEDFQTLYSMLKEKYKGKFVFVGIDKINYLSGIRNKLEGYRRYLRDLGDKYNQNILVQYFYEEDDNIDFINDSRYKDIKAEIIQVSESIKKEFGEGIIEIVEKKLNISERLAIFASGNCYVSTYQREAFSLDIYQFLSLKDILDVKSDYSYIISESSGLTTSISGAIKINSLDYNSIKNGFLEAFQIHYDGGSITTAQEKDLIQIKKNQISIWMSNFMKELRTAHEVGDNVYYIGTGIGLNFTLIKLSSQFQKLNIKKCIDDYKKAKRKLILLDYEGTLPSSSMGSEVYFKGNNVEDRVGNSAVNSEYFSKGNLPDDKIIMILEALTRDKSNTVFIVTGREKKLVHEWFSNVNNLGLASEHGYFYRYNSNHDKWDKMIKDLNSEWRKTTVELLEPYTDRCEGSFIEVKEASVVWQYRDCDHEMGKSFANVMTIDLENSLKKLNLNIINGKGYVEIKPKGINKGAFASYILKEELKKGKKPDLIICIGDDIADEEMFKYIQKVRPKLPQFIPNSKDYMITVGKKPSNAQYYVDHPLQVKELLDGFMQVSIRKKNAQSLFDLKPSNESTSDQSFSSNNSNNTKEIHYRNFYHSRGNEEICEVQSSDDSQIQDEEEKEQAL